MTNLHQQPKMLVSAKLNETEGGGKLEKCNNGYRVYFCGTVCNHQMVHHCHSPREQEMEEEKGGG